MIFNVHRGARSTIVLWVQMCLITACEWPLCLEPWNPAESWSHPSPQCMCGQSCWEALQAFPWLWVQQRARAKERSGRGISTELMANLIEPSGFLLCFLAGAEPCPSPHLLRDLIERFCWRDLAHVHFTEDTGPEHSQANPTMQVTCVMG